MSGVYLSGCTSVVSTMWSNPVFSYLLAIISAFSTFTNFKSFSYVTKTFDTSNNLFNILAKDSLTAAICSAIHLATSFINLINEDLLKSKLGCVAHFAGLFLPSGLGPVSSLLISLRRFVQLKYPNGISTMSLRCNFIFNVILTISTIYCLALLLLDTIYDFKGFNFISHCQGIQVLKDASNVSSIIHVIVVKKLAFFALAASNPLPLFDPKYLDYGLHHWFRYFEPSSCTPKQFYGCQCWSYHHSRRHTKT